MAGSGSCAFVLAEEARKITTLIALQTARQPQKPRRPRFFVLGRINELVKLGE